MQFNYKSEIKNWSVYFITIIIAVFIHELGHCIIAWANGVPAIPTPAKTYPLENISVQLTNAFSLGGISGTIAFSLAIVSAYLFSSSKFNSAVLAGALANPGMYSFLFFLKGRGHSGSEFQKAQAALGQSYSGHFLDWLLVSIFIVGAITWFIKSKAGLKIVPRIIIGFAISILFLSALQDLNNKFFDPLFN
jgi:hypothetical protein